MMLDQAIAISGRSRRDVLKLIRSKQLRARRIRRDHYDIRSGDLVRWLPIRCRDATRLH